MKSDLEIAHEIATGSVTCTEDLDGVKCTIDNDRFRERLTESLAEIYYTEEDEDLQFRQPFKDMVSELMRRTDTDEIIQDHYDDMEYRRDPDGYYGVSWSHFV